MRRSMIGWIVLALLAVGGSAFAWVWFAGGTGEPSTQLTTPTLASPSTTQPDATETTQPVETDTTVAPAGLVAFVIDSESSMARFEIDEVLRGAPKRVVGETNQVAGQVAVDPDDLSTAQFSEIVINARTFQTDSNQRDRAIRGPVILDSATDEFEFITFQVSTVDGLTGALTPGQQLAFTVTGDLSIKDTTREVVFEVEISMVDDGTIEGLAVAEVLRSDFGIGIPSVPFVADVSDEVALTLDFVAHSA